MLSRQGGPGPRRPGRRSLPPGPFRERLARIIDYKNRLLGAMLPDFEPFDARTRGRRVPGICRTAAPVRARHDDLAASVPWSGSRRLLFEGAQGSLLDIDHGSYPYVTSSNSSAAGIAAGSGVPTRHIDRWIGVVKAYTTRVGGGPFPTEQDNATGERIRRVGKEFGTVTGRPRRCGWFDAVAVRHAVRVSGSTELAVMLLDVLSGIRRAERRGGLRARRPADQPSCRAPSVRLRALPPGLRDPARLDRGSHPRSGNGPISPSGAGTMSNSSRRQVGVPVTIVSVGPERPPDHLRP